MLASHKFTHLQYTKDDYRMAKDRGVFSYVKKLKRHITVTHGNSSPNQDNSCQPCGKRFINRCALLRHIRLIHNAKKAKKFCCHICDKSFSVKHTLSLHVNKMHPTSERFQCDICNSSFFTRGEYMKHNRLHARNVSNKPLSSMQCKMCLRFCKKDLKRARYLRRHLQLCHPDEKLYYCDYCDFEVDTYKQIKMHRRSPEHLQKIGLDRLIKYTQKCDVIKTDIEDTEVTEES
ncbi:hypothetical protein NQ317_003171 [Molorchus minor]|uniref:C2H2-type domain-containing protein n=1 Tax=Molorchus minor TaxID=1323400 RepID=A0ABQ9JCB5_9CUCU|nr:hypothetical protein NQ317_003171 [Molorchus minor]